jgi:predicted phage terminase large subunit-like protein
MSLLPESKRMEILNSLTDEQAYALQYDWSFWGRPEQLSPKQWGKNGCFIWNLRMGRGAGKTRTGSELFIHAIRFGGYKFPNLAGATAEDVREIMIEGESGILACAPPDFMPEFIPSLKKLIWPNGVETHIYYGSEPNKARGPQSDYLWCDELAKWQFAEETFDNLLMGLRLGPNPLCMVTSTPKPTRFLIDLEKRVDKQGRNCTVVTRGRTKDNYKNLSPVFISTIISKYEGTRLGRQELEGEFLDDNPDALWKRSDIDKNKVREIPQLIYVVIGIDPAATSKAGSDDTGIIAAGKDNMGNYYVLDDYTLHDTPQKWGEAAITAYNKHHANLIIGETNNGGEMVENTIRQIDPRVPFRAVHASRGKETRSEPVSALYEQGKVHHFGNFSELEDQLCEWAPGADKSPDRLDALVWAITFLMNVGIQQPSYQTYYVGTGYVGSGMRI